MNASPCCSVRPGSAGRQAIGYETAAMAPVAGRANLEPAFAPTVAVQPGLATNASAIELIVVMSGEHKSLMKHLESTHKMMLSRMLQKVYGASTDLVNMPELQEEQQPLGIAGSLLAFPEPKEDQASRARAPPQREIVRVTCVSTQTSVIEAPEGASSSTDVPAVTVVDSDKTLARVGEQLEEDTSPKPKVAAVAKRDDCFAKKLDAQTENTLADGLSRQMEKVVLSTAFETVFALLIVVNALIMAAECQYRGMDVAFRVQYKGSTQSAMENWPGARTVFDVLEVMFGILFVLELLAKMLVLRRKFVRSVWNFLDAVIVGAWLMDALFVVNTEFLNPMMLRLFRLVKLLRVAKLFKTFRGFDSLSILMTSMKASISVLFWSIVLLFTVQTAAALFSFQVLEDRMKDPGDENSLILYQYFGSFTRAFLTMMEMTLVNWTPVCRILTERVDEWYALPVLCYVLVVNFAAIKVIAAVFIFETQKVASTDEDLLILQKSRQTARLEQNFAGVFKEIDDSSDGFLTWEEFERVVHDQRVLTWLAALDLDVHQCESLFCLLDDGDGKISFQEFVAGVHRLKGAAKSVDLVTMSHQQTEIHKSVGKIEHMLKNR